MLLAVDNVWPPLQCVRYTVYTNMFIWFPGYLQCTYLSCDLYIFLKYSVLFENHVPHSHMVECSELHYSGSWSFQIHTQFSNLSALLQFLSYMDILCMVCSIGSQDSYGVNIYAVTCILFAIELSDAGHALNHTRVTVLLRDHSSQVTPDSQYSSKG